MAISSSFTTSTITNSTLKVGEDLENMGWIYIQKLQEIIDVYRDLEYISAFNLAQEAIKMPNLPSYVRAQILLILSVLGYKPHDNIREAIKLMRGIYTGNRAWSAKRDDAFERCLIVAEEFRGAIVAKPEKDQAAKYVVGRMKKSAEGKKFVDGVEETMKLGEQWERGFCILDAHERVFEVVMEEVNTRVMTRNTLGVLNNV